MYMLPNEIGMFEEKYEQNIYCIIEVTILFGMSHVKHT